MPQKPQRKALILANGTFPRRTIVEELSKSATYIVCADGGANQARSMWIRPTVVIGDFDSLLSGVKEYFSDVEFLHDPGQESTDLEKAIEHCIGKKFKTVDILGATGTRIDHSTGSLGCFKKYSGKIEIRMIDTAGTLTGINGSVTLNVEPEEKISLIPLDRCTGVTTTGLLYALKNESLELGVREGISNEATGTKVTVTVKKGTLLLYRFNQW